MNQKTLTPLIFSYYINDNDVGEVLSEPFSAAEFLATVRALLEDSVTYERKRERCWDFTEKPEIYSLSKAAVNQIETFQR